MIEVEFRGPLSTATREKLILYGTQHGTFLGESNQLAIFCDTWGEQFGNFYNPKVRIAVQLSCNVRTTERLLQLKVKNGHWASTGRQELVLHLHPHDLGDAYRFLGTFGVTYGCPRFYHRIDYKIGNVTLSLKDGGLAPDHWEAEMTATKSDEKKARLALQRFIKEFRLTSWSEATYTAMIKKIYQENPPMKFSDIDVSAAFP